MTDDIVYRLRLNYCHGAHDSYYEDYNGCETCEAADEIERLRALINHGLTDAYQCAGCDLCEQLKAMHLKAVKP